MSKFFREMIILFGGIEPVKRIFVYAILCFHNYGFMVLSYSSESKELIKDRWLGTVLRWGETEYGESGILLYFFHHP